MSWLARAEQACVAVEVIIGFNWAHHIGVDDRARAAVPFLVSITIGCGEEDYFVLFGNNNKRYGRVEIKCCTCFCGLAIVKISLGARTRGKGEKGGDGLRMKLSSSLTVVRNSPSETPSWRNICQC